MSGQFRPAFNTVNDPGDSTKVIYLSPQFFGFDAGGSFAFNNQEGPLSGCDSLTNIAVCDRLSAIAGINTRRSNEVQAALRWRGSFGPMGLAATVGYFGADAIKNTTGPSPSHMNMYWAGAQATAYGFTVGGWYTGGNANAGYATLVSSRPGYRVDDRNVGSYLLGATYTIDAFTVGGHFAKTASVGVQSPTIQTGAREDTGFSVGGNYRVAPGLDFFAEYNNIHRKELNYNFTTAVAGSGTSGANISIVLAGFRVAF